MSSSLDTNFVSAACFAYAPGQCVCACVCVRERERGREGKMNGDIHLILCMFNSEREVCARVCVCVRVQGLLGLICTFSYKRNLWQILLFTLLFTNIGLLAN